MRIKDGLTAPAQAALGDGFEMPKLSQFEGVAWPLLQQRPAHLLSRRFATWDALLEDAAQEVRDGLSAQGPLDQRSEEHTSELQSLMRISSAVFCLKKTNTKSQD